MDLQTGDTSRWPGDVLARSGTGDFLTLLIRQRYERVFAQSGRGALCVALDDDWGNGKTFFLNHWAEDLKTAGYPVVRFDAWVNDLSEDPLIGFMAHLDKDLKRIVDPKLPKQAKQKLKRLYEATKRAAPRAVLPIVGAFTTTLLRAAAGPGIDGALKVLKDEITSDKPAEVGGEALRQLFESAASTHLQKQDAIKEFKCSLTDLLTEAEKAGTFKLPLFILVDELDRCRPDFAIRLLEGVKHLFDSQGVCFVFGTNLSQLKESAKAVYGQSFDGLMYLKRFFAYEFRLPKPSNEQFARKLLLDTSLVARGNIVDPLPKRVGPTPLYNPAAPEGQLTRNAEVLAKTFGLVSEAFGLSLRSQEQVMQLADAAAAGIDDDQPTYCLVLFMFAAAYHKSFPAFDAARGSSIEPIRSLVTGDPTIEYSVRTPRGYQTDKKSLFEIFQKYMLWSQTSVRALFDEAEDQAHPAYPGSLRNSMLDELRSLNSGRPAGGEISSSLTRYHELVSRAGQALVRRDLKF